MFEAEDSLNPIVFVKSSACCDVNSVADSCISVVVLIVVVLSVNVTAGKLEGKLLEGSSVNCPWFWVVCKSKESVLVLLSGCELVDDARIVEDPKVVVVDSCAELVISDTHVGIPDESVIFSIAGTIDGVVICSFCVVSCLVVDVSSPKVVC